MNDNLQQTGSSMTRPTHNGLDDANSSPTAAQTLDTRDEAIDRAGDVKDSAIDAGAQVTSVAKDEAAAVAAEASDHIKHLLSQGRSEFAAQAGAQQKRLAQGLHSLSDEFRSMAQSNENGGPATQLADQAAGKARSIAGWLENRDPQGVVEDVSEFARRKPGLFIAIAAGAGLVVGRFARGLMDDSSSATPQAADSTYPSGEHLTGNSVYVAANGADYVSSSQVPTFGSEVR